LIEHNIKKFADKAKILYDSVIQKYEAQLKLWRDNRATIGKLSQITTDRPQILGGKGKHIKYKINHMN